MNNEMSYEEAMKVLTEITEKLQAGNTTLDESLLLFEKGAEAARICYAALSKAEEKIKKLTEEKEIF